MLKENIIKELEGFKTENRFRTIKTNDKSFMKTTPLIIINYHRLHQD